MSEYETGYKRPPRKSQYKKGQSGNPKSRPRKASLVISTDDAEILRRLDSEIIDVGGRLMTRRQAEIHQLWNLAVKGIRPRSRFWKSFASSRRIARGAV